MAAKIRKVYLRTTPNTKKRAIQYVERKAMQTLEAGINQTSKPFSIAYKNITKRSTFSPG